MTAPPTTAAADRAVFALWRAAALLRHPRLHWKYVRRMRRLPDVAVPVLFSERMLWRKLFDRNPDFVTFSDKLACKRWIAERAPDLAIPRVLWEGERAEDIPPALIRPGVAIKANHGSGFNRLIRDAPPPPREQVVATARRWLARDWGRHRGEWCYAAVPRRVFVEELVTPAPDETLFDLKVHAGGGEMGFCGLFTDTKTPRQRSRRYHADGTPMAETVPGYAALPDDQPLPPGFHRAVAIARRLSREVDYARFDFLVHGEHVFAGEITVFTAAGYRDFSAALAPVMTKLWDLRRAWPLRADAARDGWLARAYRPAAIRAVAAQRMHVP